MLSLFNTEHNIFCIYCTGHKPNGSSFVLIHSIPCENVSVYFCALHYLLIKVFPAVTSEAKTEMKTVLVLTTEPHTCTPVTMYTVCAQVYSQRDKSQERKLSFKREDS